MACSGLSGPKHNNSQEQIPISELINKLRGAKYFTKLDVRWGFNNVRPLFDLTWKDTEWRWGAEEQSAFNSLKERITTAPILALPDNS